MINRHKIKYLVFCFLVSLYNLLSAQQIADSTFIYERIEEAKKLQETYPDSAIKLYKQAIKTSVDEYYPEIQIEIGYKLYEIYLKNGDFTEAEQCLQNAMEICHEEEITSKLHEINNKFGWFYFMKGNYPKAIEYTNNALSDSQISEFEKSKAYNTLGVVYKYLGNYTKSLSYYYKGLKIHEQSNYQRGIAATYNNLAAIYSAQNQIQKALSLYIKANHIFEREKDTAHISLSLNNIATMYLVEEQYDSAFPYYQKAYEINKEKGYILELGNVSLNLGKLYADINDFDKSTKYLNDAIEIFQKTNNKHDLALCFHEKGLLLSKQEKNELAHSHLQRALKYAQESKSYGFQIDILNDLSRFYGKNEDYKKAYLFFEKYVSLKDSIFSIEKTQTMENITAVYEIEKREQKIELLEKEKEIKTFKNYLLSAVILGLLILLGVTVYIFIMRTRGAKQKLTFLREAQRANSLELEKKKLLLEKQDLTNEKLKAELSFKEKELETSAMHFIQTNENNIKVVKELTTLKEMLKPSDEEHQKLISQLVRNISIKKSDDIWKEFEIRFTQIHEDFYEKLNERYPDLTPNEKKLCAYLKLNMTTKEISMVTHQSPNSIRVARTRLRKKLDITSDENLVSFFASIN